MEECESDRLLESREQSTGRWLSEIQLAPSRGDGAGTNDRHEGFQRSEIDTRFHVLTDTFGSVPLLAMDNGFPNIRGFEP
jgi:hypothetical protein